MTRRTLLPVLVLLALVTALSLPADAHHKPQHKTKQASQPSVVRGSYQLQLRPDPCGHTSGAALRGWGCFAVTNGHVGRVPDSSDSRGFRFSRPGTFRASLKPDYTTQPVVPEWDLELRPGGGAWQRARPHDGSYEISFGTAQAPATFQLRAGNMSGWPDATVTWSFTYRPPHDQGRSA
jgi:hypothetical protein